MVNELIARALRQHQAGRTSEAKSIYEQVLAIDPRHPDALHLLGVIQLQAGDASRAVDLIQRASRCQPRNWHYLSDLAQAYTALQRFEEAYLSFQAAARLNRANPQPAVGAANCRARQGQFAVAEEALRKIARRFPTYAPAWFNLANAVRDQGRYEEAVTLYRRALDRAPGSVDAHNNLGQSLHALERFDEAEQAYRRSIELQPDYAIGYCNLASVMVDRGKPAAAETLCRKALVLQPAMREVERVLCRALMQQGRLTEALGLERAMLARQPGNAVLQCSLGYGLCLAGRAGEGMSFIERAIEMEPNLHEARFARATVRLASGDLPGGWDDYVFRPARGRFLMAHPGITPATALPAALGERDVCLLREQGIGDEIFFLRFAPLLKSRGARITYCATPKIAPLIARSPLFDRVIDEGEALPPAEFTVLVGDLPLALGASGAGAHSSRSTTGGDNASDASRHTPGALALAPLVERLTEMRQRLTQLGPPPYLGLTWRGGTAPQQQRGVAWLLHKGAPIPGLAAAVKPVAGTLLVLQRAPEPGEIEELQGHLSRAVHDLSALNEDLEGMLALLALIDEYVGVSNANMHLRASVGKTARVLVPCPAEWRWMAEGAESPWFPGFPIYRQQPDGNWSAAITRLASDLAG